MHTTKSPRLASYSTRSHVSALAALCLAGLPCSAATFTWNNVTGDWSVPGNWAGGVAPGSDPANELNFGGADPAYTARQDSGAAFELNVLRLNSAVLTATQILNGAAGSSLSFVNDGADPALIQQGAGAFDIDLPLALGAPMTFDGTGGGGLVSLFGPISGTNTLAITGGNWRFRDTGSTWSGATTISGGAAVELQAEGTGNLGINFAGSGANGIFGTNNTITLNGGSLALNTQGTGNIALGTNRSLTFGANGGTFTMVNSNPSAATTHAGHIASGDLAFTLNNSAGNPAVIQFNGGQVGLSQIGSPFGGDWSTGGNVLRLRSIGGSGPLRVELTNGAMFRGGVGAGATTDSVISAPTTVRGVLGGDPTSGPDGTVSSGVSTNTGRIVLDYRRSTFSGGLTFENAIQVAIANRATALNGHMTIAGDASGNPGYVTFSGRGTGTALGSPIRNPGENTAGGNNVLWLGENTTDSSLTVEGGGIAVFDARIRIDQGNHHGVLMTANTTLEPGGALRIAQSMSNYSNVTNLNTTANAGDIVLRGNIIGQGTTANESILDLRLPTPDASGTIANGVPTPLTTTSPGAGTRPFGGLTAEAGHNIVVDGSGFGGLRIEANARPDRLFSETGAPGGNATADPTPNLTKMEGYLTPARINAVTGAGGYLTIAPSGETYTMPDAEWSSAEPVGLKVVNHNPAGVDVQFDAAKTTWEHNLHIAAEGTLHLGSNPFTFGPAAATAGLGLLSGDGAITGSGGLTLSSGAILSPGEGAVGSLTTENITFSLGTTFVFDLATPASSDFLTSLGVIGLSGQQFEDFTFNALPGFSEGTYVLFEGAAISGSLGASRTGTISGMEATLDVDGNDVTLTVVPEPSALLSLVGGCALLLARRRRRF